PPIILELGQGLDPDGLVQVADDSLSDGSAELEHCVLEAATYAKALERRRARDQQARGQQTEDQKARERQAEEELATAWYLLKAYGAVVLMPRAPLKPGHAYSVSITADSKRYDWSFRVAADGK